MPTFCNSGHSNLEYSLEHGNAGHHDTTQHRVGSMRSERYES